MGAAVGEVDVLAQGQDLVGADPLIIDPDMYVDCKFIEIYYSIVHV